MTRFRSLIALAPAGALAFAAPQLANAAATTQTTHAYLCASDPASGQAGSRQVTNTSSTATTQPTYLLNGQGCAVIATADVGYFLSQGFTYGQNVFSLVQTAITATTTTSTSTITLPVYGIIYQIVLEETAGNAITGGVDVGDAGSATRFASATALGANATVVAPDSGNARLFSNAGVPAADQILVACHTSCNSGSININIIYGYY